MNIKSQKLIDPSYLSFPFRVDEAGVENSKRKEHVRQQIEQVLFTDPKERIFRQHFGAGVRSHIFDGNVSELWNIIKKRLVTILFDVLAGEVEPKTIEVDVTGQDGDMLITISYKLATINQTENHEFLISGGING